MEGAHEIVHAEQFARFWSRGNFSSIDDAANAFFGVSQRVYARQERVAESLARARVSQHLGGVSPQQWAASTRYIDGWG
jgi:hypothetical protein